MKINCDMMEQMIEDIRSSEVISFDTESHELLGHPYRISIATKDNAYSCCLDPDEFFGFGGYISPRWLRWILSNKKVIMHNAKYDKEVMKKWLDIDIPDYECTMVIAHLLDEEQPKSLKKLAVKYLGVENWDVGKETKLGTKKVKSTVEILPDKRPPRKWHNLVAKYRKELQEHKLTELVNINAIEDRDKKFYFIDIYSNLVKYAKLISLTEEEYQEAVRKSKEAYSKDEAKLMKQEKKIEEEYSRLDARHTYDLFMKLYPMLEDEKLIPVYENIEKPLIEPLVEMELGGVPINREGIEEIEKKAQEKAEALLGEIKAELGDVDINSPKQLAEALFESGRIEPLEGRSEKSKCYSTRAEILDKLAEMGHSIAQKIVEYRNYQKLLSTYMFKEDRLHSSFNALGTASGRFCVSENTLLITNQGNINILDVFNKEHVPYKVLSHTGEYRGITDKIYKGKEEMYEIELENGEKLQCTKAHRVLTKCGWKSIGDLREGDKILSYNSAIE